MDDMPAIATVSRYNENGRRGAGNTADGLTTHLNRARRAGMNATHKTCPKCTESKPVDAFGRNRAAYDGLQTWCQVCRRSYHSQNRAEINARVKQRKDRDRDVERRKSQAWRDANREAIREYTRAYRQENIDAIQARAWKSRYEHRARSAGYTPIAVLLTRQDVITTYGDRCAYCGGDFEELDHFTPVTKGGQHVLGNVRPSCRTCNRRKYNVDGTEWGRDA